jgi:hypothetical protein
VSDYELKGMMRFIITDDMPDMFDIKVSYHQFNDRPELWNHQPNSDGTYEMPVPIGINLTVDMSESKVEKLVVKPDISATVIQPKSVRYLDEYESDYDIDYTAKILAGDFDEDEDIDVSNIYIEYNTNKYPSEVEHNITIDRVSISPLGNILVMTEKGADNPVNRELFDRYFIVDDKGNFYRRYEDVAKSRKEWTEDETSIVEFFGNAPDDIQYLKLIPYKLHDNTIFAYPEEYPEADLGNLPQTLKQSDHGSVIIESYTVTDDEFIFTYRYEGIVSERLHFMLTVIDGEKPLTGSRGYSYTLSINTQSHNSYTRVYTFANPIENLKDIVKSIQIVPQVIELLEEQAIIIPLK